MGTRQTEFHQASAGDLKWPLDRAAALYGPEVGVSDVREGVTYAELARRVGALGARLDELGVGEGSRVGFLGINSLAHLECWMAVPAARRVLVDLNFRLSPAELRYIVDDCEIELLIVDPQQLEVARGLRDACATLAQLVYDGPAPCPEDCVNYGDLMDGESYGRVACDGMWLAAISYTGGTTGRPKGVMLSHGNLLANARHNLIAIGHTREDRWVHVSPMFHVAGTANIFACTWVGARQFVLPRFDARAVIDIVRREQITHMLLVPTMLGMLLDELDREQGGEGLPSLRHIQYAASPITPALQRRLLESFACDVVQCYGMTEAAPSVTSLSGRAHRAGARGESPWDERLRSIGVPLVGVQAEVRRPDGTSLPPGQVGELWVRGPNVMLGYWGQPEVTAAALAGGWYRTGDAARADAGGYLYLVDRLKDMIITGAENVYSIEVEAALAEHPAVFEAAVFGVPDARWGEAVQATVSLVSGATATPDELIAHCRTLIAGYKVPRAIDVRTERLPKSGAGKPLKNELREPYWAGHDRRVS